MVIGKSLEEVAKVFGDDVDVQSDVHEKGHHTIMNSDEKVKDEHA